MAAPFHGSYRHISKQEGQPRGVRRARQEQKRVEAEARNELTPPHRRSMRQRRKASGGTE